MIIAGVTGDNVYEVLPDDERCVQPPCLYLNYLIDNHQDYFTSNTRIMFSGAQYSITNNNMIIQNVSNISLLSASDIEIVCSPQKFLLFHNVVNLTITNMFISECGNLINNDSHWASVVFNECTNVLLTDVYISSPVGYGIIAYNMFGYNILENISVYLGREKSLQTVYNSKLHTCSYGMHLSYFDSEGTETGKTNAIVIISNIGISLMPSNKRRCKGCCGFNYYQRFRGMFEIFLKQNHYNVLITIKNSRFSYLIGNIFMINVESLANNSISFNDCKFTNINNHEETKDRIINTENFSQKVVSIYYRIKCDNYLKHLNFHVSFVDCNFRHNTYNIKKDDYILHIEAVINCNHENRSIMLISFRNVTFYKNEFGILNVTSSMLPIFSEPSVSIITEHEFHIQGNSALYDELIYLNNVQVHFNGITRFVENIFTTIICSDSSKLIFTNTTIFHENLCYYLLRLNGKWLHISLAEHANFTISSNELENEIISVSKVYNNPFPYCIIQLNSDFYQNFSISIFNNIEKSVNSNRSNSTINKLTSHCKLNTGRKYHHFEDSLIIYKQIINYKQKYEPLGIHTDICYCPSNASYNCSDDWLGKVYPGQTLTVDLCLPYINEESRILCVETYNDYLPPNACKVYSQLESKHVVFGKHSIKVNFSIASNHPTRCELFLTAQPDLYTHYDTFNIQIVPCPLGFALHDNICDCDPQLSPYTEECIINYQEVKRLANCWISGNTGENSTKYYVTSQCPVFYCSQTTTFVNVQEPDAQCQQHRSGTMCSQCKPGYSLVLGSSECKKCACTNVHLTFIALLLFNGFLLFAVIFILNLTVTVGTINPLILYMNVIQINNFSLHLQSRLIKPLYVYVKIVNLGSYIEMCVYDGMDMYAKKWIQLAYPMYVLLIACLFIVASRYSNKLFRLTHNRSLPILATLFVLIYTNEIESISNVFLFASITSLPSMQLHVVWYLDPNIKLYGWKYLLLFIVCLILLLFLLILNAVLLFTRTLMRFRVIHRMKPIIDALQGPFKSRYYYWMGVHLLIRNAMLLISILEKHISITVGCIIVLIGAIVQSYLQPYKSIITNIQEIFLFCNYSVLSVLLLFNGGEFLNIIVLNVMIGLSFLQFMLIIAYHIHKFVFMHHCVKVQDTTRAVWTKIKTLCYWNRRQNDRNNEITELQIPEVTFNYSEFQEPLLGLD